MPVTDPGGRLCKEASERHLHEDPRSFPDYTEQDLHALLALQRGSASPDQQRHALEYMVNWLCGTYDIAYRDDERLTTLALGKQLVGQHLVHMLKRAPTKLKGENG